MKTTPSDNTATEDDLFRTAIHEAGHAVVALKLGARVEYVEIGPGAADADPSAYVKALGVVRVGVTKLVPSPSDPTFGMTKLGYLVHCLTGDLAEKRAGVYRETPYWVYSGDLAHFAEALAVVPMRMAYTVQKRAEAEAKRLVDEHWPEILHLARQLLTWRYFGEGEVGEVVKGAPKKRH
jgi:hypothetical protein